MAAKTAKPHVLIVGAGLGGLALAQCLRKQEIPFEIFEREPDISSRSQGYAIGMHYAILEDLAASFCSDMPPLRESAGHLLPLKLPSQMCFHLRGLRLCTTDTPETPCLRANRLRLREWLATRIPINWGKRLESVQEQDDGKVTLNFADGTSACGDIIVGADGMKSVVRRHLLPGVSLNSLPFATITGEAVLSGEAMERQLSMGHSAYMTSPADGSCVLFVGLNQAHADQRSGDYYWNLTWDDEDAGRPDYWLKSASRAKKLERALEMTQHVDPRFSEVIRLTRARDIRDGQMTYGDVEMPEQLPAGSRITLLGDAAHPMTPFRGEGGMHAFRDALNLARELCEMDVSGEPGEVEAGLAAYQREMLRRGGEAARMSRNAIRNNRDGGNRIVCWGHAAQPTPEVRVSLEACRS
ncbi:FAD/NAD(P)-binding domain-containing protein [Xylariaceae sp. FL0804]|nr:FAD/NAD(P)-binding domain-containing protein [Xylariaceae sp. FL0804]